MSICAATLRQFVDPVPTLPADVGLSAIGHMLDACFEHVGSCPRW
jgi:hypothetical protein